MTTVEWLQRQPRERLAERVSAATYGTVLVLAALPLIDVSDVSSNAGWGLVTGVGVATYVAHAYAEVMGDHLRHESPLHSKEVSRALRDGVPILVTAVAPAIALGLGRVNVIGNTVALWIAVVVAILQLVAIGAFVGWAVTPRPARWWAYGTAAAAIGVVVVVLKFSLSH